jgi:hypothetical protein
MPLIHLIIVRHIQVYKLNLNPTKSEPTVVEKVNNNPKRTNFMFYFARHIKYIFTIFKKILL